MFIPRCWFLRKLLNIILWGGYTQKKFLGDLLYLQMKIIGFYFIHNMLALSNRLSDFYLFIHLFDLCFLSFTQEFFTYMKASSNMVEGNQVMSEGSPRPFADCWQTLPLTAREEAGMSWIRTHNHRIGVRLLGYCVVIVCQTTEPWKPLSCFSSVSLRTDLCK